MLLQQAGLRASACGQPQLVASTSPRCTPPCLTSGGRAWRGAWSKSKQGGRRAPCARVAAWGGLGKLMGGGGEEAGSAPAPSLPTTQFPPYQVIYKTSDYDLRLYEVYPVVTMPYERREEGYGALGGYIDGSNATRTQFAYTQPVTMTYAPNAPKMMSMFVGSQRGGGGGSGSALPVSALPAPTDPAVRLQVAGGELIAVAKFEGYITPTAAEAVRQRLMAALERDGIKLSDAAAAGEFRVGQFGAVYQLAARYNELYLRVQA